MKKIAVIFFLIVIFLACKKTAMHTMVQPPADTKLISSRGYSQNAVFVADTFIYSASGNLLTQQQWSYTSGVSNNDTFTISFLYAGGSNEPESYTLTDGYGVNTYSLTYDGQGRIAGDTIIPDLAYRASSFSYPGNNIVYNSADNRSTDTFFLSYNNIIKASQASVPFDPLVYYVTAFLYETPYPNPYYYTGQTRNVGILLTKVSGWESYQNDYVSLNSYTNVRDNIGFSADVTYTIDPLTGRVIKATGSDFFYVYTYQ